MGLLSWVLGRVIGKMGYLKQQAERGDVEMMTCLGLEYSDRKDFQEAMRWWQKAADLGSPSAQLMLGAAFDYGNGVQQNKAEAVRWYRMAAEQGNTAAQGALAASYFLGEGVAKDTLEGIRWSRAAAEQGGIADQILLAGTYANSDFVPKDKVEAVHWYSVAFNASSLTRRVARQYADELKWFLWAADCGDSDVLLNVGNIYNSRGGGVPQDHMEALRWYKMAAEKGNEEALCFIAHMYETGEGVTQDYAEALRWYNIAAEKGNAGAMFNIAMMYTRSQGVTIDSHELYFWFYLCSTHPLPEPQGPSVRQALEVIKTKLTPESIAEIQGRAQKWIDTHPKIHFRVA